MVERADERGRRWGTIGLLAFAIVGTIVHQLGPGGEPDGWWFKGFNWRLWDWYVEDAAISFAYARNWAEGDGLVAFRGGERIEGYSNPTWVALLALWHLVGVDGFTSSKIMAIGLSVATVLLLFRTVQEIADDGDSWAPHIAALLYAANPNLAFYNAAGLENPLFNFLLLGGLWRTVVEGRRGGFPWAAVWFLLLACTRPEGIMYGAWGGLVWMLLSLAHGRGIRPTVVWLVSFFVPFAVYHGIRYSYFGWAFPNTYYAKLGDDSFRLFQWMSHGWKELRKYGTETGMGWFMPVTLAGVVGLRGDRWLWVVIGSALAAVGFLYPDAEITKAWAWWPKDMPRVEPWNELRVWILAGGAALTGIVALRDARAPGRVLAFGFVLIPLYFNVHANGDWMKGFRWVTFAQVPLMLLLSLGIAEVAALAQRLFSEAAGTRWTTPGWLAGSLLTLGVFPMFISHSVFLLSKREIGPYSVKERVDYTTWLGERLWRFDERIHNLDVDMGAHMWWTDHYMLDMAGLVDIPVAQHAWKQRKFAEHYVYDEHPPHFAHLHGGWANKSKLKTYAPWKRGWIELPGYPVSRRTYHMGNHARRDLLMAERWTGPAGRQVLYDRGIALEGFDVPSPEVAAGGALYVEYGASYRHVDAGEEFRVLGLLAQRDGAGLHVFDLPTGYDWLPPTQWRLDEVFVGRFHTELRDDLPPGAYDLGFVVLGADGAPVPRRAAEDGGLPVPLGAVAGGEGDEPARFAVGEVRFRGVVTVGPAGSDRAQAEADRATAVEHAAAGRCDEAAAAWRRARLHVPHDRAWWTAQRPETEVARCYARRAAEQAVSDPLIAAPTLERARIWHRRDPEVHAVAVTVGEALFEMGHAAMDARQWAEAYAAYDGAVTANPVMPWARRAAEQARDLMLGLVEPVEPGPATPPLETDAVAEP